MIVIKWMNMYVNCAFVFFHAVHTTEEVKGERRIESKQNQSQRKTIAPH